MLSNTRRRENFGSENHENINPHTPVSQKVAEEVVFRHFQGEEVEFFFN